MNRDQVLSILIEHREEMQRRFAVKRLSLFGSAARDQLREDSDIDILVAFDGPATFDGYFDLKDDLERILGKPVDLVTEKGLKPGARPYVEKDLIRVA